MPNPEPDPKAARLRQIIPIVLFSFYGTTAIMAFLTWLDVGRESVPHGKIEEAAVHPLTIPFAAAALVCAVLSFVVKGMLSRGAPSVDKKLGAVLAAFALSESAAVFGFVLGQTTRSFGISVPFFCAAGILFVLHWPRE